MGAHQRFLPLQLFQAGAAHFKAQRRQMVTGALVVLVGERVFQETPS
jgi:hypothetical protein